MLKAMTMKNALFAILKRHSLACVYAGALCFQMSAMAKEPAWNQENGAEPASATFKVNLNEQLVRLGQKDVGANAAAIHFFESAGLEFREGDLMTYNPVSHLLWVYADEQQIRRIQSMLKPFQEERHMVQVEVVLLLMDPSVQSTAALGSDWLRGSGQQNGRSTAHTDSPMGIVDKDIYQMSIQAMERRSGVETLAKSTLLFAEGGTSLVQTADGTVFRVNLAGVSSSNDIALSWELSRPGLELHSDTVVRQRKTVMMAGTLNIQDPGKGTLKTRETEQKRWVLLLTPTVMDTEGTLLEE